MIVKEPTVFRIVDLLAFVVLGIGAGVSFVMQQAVNANLRATLGSAAWAGFVSYLGGTLCMLALAFAMREPFPSVGAATQSNWWAWTGGFFGAIYIAVSILLVPRLGTATFVALLLAGQMLFSLACDHFGLFGVPQHSADVPRLLGAVLLAGGVALIRL
jgi:bacterial/archaeal transporter family-2 protein